jgi:methyl-accepting chemotaxis protein
MVAVQSVAMFFWQSEFDASIAHDVHWMTVAVIVIAAIMVGVLLAVFIGGAALFKLMKKFESFADDAQARATPLIAKGEALFDDLAPKIRNISTNVEQISYTARSKADELGETVSQINRTVVDVNTKARVQSDRVHGLVTEALNTTQEVSQAVQHGIRVPVRKIAAIVAGVKAGLEEFIERSPFAGQLGKRSKGPGPYDL